MRSMPSTNPSRVVEALASVSLIRTTLPLVRSTSVPTDERLAAALDQVAFPMARDQPSLDFPRAAVDARHVADLAALFVDLGAPPPVRLVLPEASQQLLLQLPARQGVDRLVDRLMRHRQPGSCFDAAFHALP